MTIEINYLRLLLDASFGAFFIVSAYKINPWLCEIVSIGVVYAAIKPF